MKSFDEIQKDVLSLEDKINISDGYHSFNELYNHRASLTALLFNEWANRGVYNVCKSKRHINGEKCFNGDMFIVLATLPAGNISYHYKMEEWGKFQIPEIPKQNHEWDYTPQDVENRLNDLFNI